MSKYIYQASRFGILVCRNKAGKFLCVKQTRDRGWWLPGGKLEPGETFLQAAIRQATEETHITPQIKGIIRVDYGKYMGNDVIRCIYYAEPVDQTQKPKSFGDENSDKAQFLTIQQIYALKNNLRGSEIYHFSKYIADGGQIYPLSIFEQNFTRPEIL